MARAGSGLVLAAGLALAMALPAARAAEPLKIGFIATLSSPTSRAGPDMLDGFRLGLKQAGNRLGGREAQLVVGDDQLKPDVGVQLARKMLDDDKVQLMSGLV